MKTVDVDARRYAWCRGQAVWRMAIPITALLEDMRGGLAEEQDGLVRHAARAVGQHCAVVLALVLFHERPIPAARMRASWALGRLSGHELGDRCRLLIAGDPGVPPVELVRRSEELVDRVRELVGHVPDPMTPGGYFPAMALAREWLRLIESVGEEGFLPREWIRDEESAP